MDNIYKEIELLILLNKESDKDIDRLIKKNLEDLESLNEKTLKVIKNEL